MARRSIVCGVGINDADYAVYPASKTGRKVCPFYNRWKGMITRCYSGRPKDLLLYDGCVVADEWMSFMAFREWMQAQPWKGNHLDKDILSPFEKRYSPDTSVFVPAWINTLMNDCSASAGTLPTGVYLLRGRYIARVHDGHGKRVFIGSFESADEAHLAWAAAKSLVIKEAIGRYRLTDRFDERICRALLARADELNLSSASESKNRPSPGAGRREAVRLAGCAD